tara:strand:- start:1791 stop:2738 length:948 start_codon:yes stop_codon:yes gene_type:complete
MKDEFIWVEKYRPKTIDDCILPEDIKKTFNEFLKQGAIPNLLLSGPPGIGKTTVARALCEQLGADYYIINGSDEGRFLDTVRNQAKNFASTVSLMDSDASHKVIIIDEADNTTNDVQLLLRANIEAFYKNCRFIFTCNFKNRIIEPLHSRCSVIDFAVDKKNRPAIMAQFFKRLTTILELEKIEAEKKVILELINKHFPDWRRVLNECQRHSVTGQIDSSILVSISQVNIEDLLKSLKAKDFEKVRKWCVNNLDSDAQVLMRRIYDALYENFDNLSKAAAVPIVAKYQYNSTFVADQEINLLAFLTEIMVECEFK